MFETLVAKMNTNYPEHLFYFKENHLYINDKKQNFQLNFDETIIISQKMKSNMEDFLYNNIIRDLIEDVIYN